MTSSYCSSRWLTDNSCVNVFLRSCSVARASLATLILTDIREKDDTRISRKHPKTFCFVRTYDCCYSSIFLFYFVLHVLLLGITSAICPLHCEAMSKLLSTCISSNFSQYSTISIIVFSHQTLCWNSDALPSTGALDTDGVWRIRNYFQPASGYIISKRYMIEALLCNIIIQ